ncbi:MAG: hypothetical protein AAGI10_11125 [Pseudomonadota bacterium]
MKMLITASILAIGATAASASNSFGILVPASQSDSYYDVKVVRAEEDAVVQVQTWDGEVLGSTEISAGTHTRVRVDLIPFGMPATDAYAVLLIDGEVVDRDRIRIF